MRLKIFFFFLICWLSGSIILFSGCSFFRAPEKITVAAPAKFMNALKPSAYAIKNDWWKNFDDPVLNAIVRRALKRNITYKIAVKNIQVAKTYVEENEAGLFPQFNLNSSASRNQPSLFQGPFQIPRQNIYNMFQIGASASYEADVWNSIGNTLTSTFSVLWFESSILGTI